MLIPILLLIVGLVVLITGGELLVRGASSIALRFQLSPLVVGLTIVAFGTSAPELFISLQSALQGSPDLAMGNVVGSNICNLALVLGTTAVIFPVPVQGDSIKIDWPVTMGSSLLLYALVQENLISMWEGLLFVSILIVYTVFVIRKSRREIKAGKEMLEDADIPDEPSSNPFKDVFFILLGIAGLSFGSDWFVDGAKELALAFGVSERIIGITLLALGTSLPELVTATVAAFKRESDIAVGNLMGSNVFNILSILGITSIVQPISVNQTIINSDMIWMLGITLLILPMMMIRRTISRPEGAILLSIYIYYIYTVVVPM
jgi:cation:H+ antiporter